MDPTCPRYGLGGLPLPKALEALFPVRRRFESNSWSHFLFSRTGLTRKRTRPVGILFVDLVICFLILA